MGNSKSKKVKQTPDETDIIEKKKQLCRVPCFTDLSPEGRDCFMKYLETEENFNDARRLKFWFMSDSLEESKSLLDYLKDGPDQLRDVTNLRNLSDDLKVIEKGFDKTENVVEELRTAMRPDLEEKFEEFQDSLKKEIAKATGSGN